MTGPLIAACGDAIVDFVPVRSTDGRDCYLPVAGGSCLNLAVAAARLGVPVAFVGGLSTDLWGDFLASHMAASGVDLTWATRAELENTLAFVKMENNEARYAFYDDNSAGRQWDVPPALLPLHNIAALHVGSVTLIHEPAGASYERLVAAAHPTCLISLDPNCRPSLIRDATGYRDRISRLAALSDIVRMSVEDMTYLHGDASEWDVAAGLHGQGVKVVLITRGPGGATAYLPGGRIDVPSAATKVVDTIGAGDSFHGAFLVALRHLDLLDRAALARVSSAEIGMAMTYASTAAAITCGRHGADPPWRDELVPPRSPVPSSAQGIR